MNTTRLRVGWKRYNFEHSNNLCPITLDETAVSKWPENPSFLIAGEVCGVDIDKTGYTTLGQAPYTHIEAIIYINRVKHVITCSPQGLHQ